jgi:hypothetical protein
VSVEHQDSIGVDIYSAINSVANPGVPSDVQRLGGDKISREA